MPRLDPLVALLDAMQPSLAMYLADSGIWTYPGDEEIKLAIADLVGDHRSIVERAAVMLEEKGGVPSSPVYPITYSSCHDVDIASLVPRVIDGLRGQVAAADAIIASSAGESEAAVGLAREAKATSLRHVEVLGQVLAAARLRRSSAVTKRSEAAAAPQSPAS